MIIDCHGHYTTEPHQLHDFRKKQTEAAKKHEHFPPYDLKITDDQIRESLEGAQLKFQRERGTDLTIFSPRAAGMGHHIGDARTSMEWTRLCNDLIHSHAGSLSIAENYVGLPLDFAEPKSV